MCQEITSTVHMTATHAHFASSHRVLSGGTAPSSPRGASDVHACQNNLSEHKQSLLLFLAKCVCLARSHCMLHVQCEAAPALQTVPWAWAHLQRKHLRRGRILQRRLHLRPARAPVRPPSVTTIAGTQWHGRPAQAQPGCRHQRPAGCLHQTNIWNPCEADTPTKIRIHLL